MADLTHHPLFEAVPSLAGRVSRVPLGSFPTRVERLSNLERRLGFASCWIKRDDQSGKIHGGNKVRKLEYLLAGFSASEHRRVVAYGPVSSHWTLACTIYARRVGIPVHVLLFRMKGVVPHDESISLQMDLADNFEVRSRPSSLLPRLLMYTLVSSPSRRFTILPPGGTSSTSILGYVNAFLELAGQVEAGVLPMPDVIVLPLGTGGTAAGLAAGIAMRGSACRVLGVRVAARSFSNVHLSRALANASLRILTGGGRRTPIRLRKEILDVDGGYCGRGYGRETGPGLEAARIVREEEGVMLDATYTAKAMACLLHRSEEGWGHGENVLFWHTLNSVPLDTARRAFS